MIGVASRRTGVSGFAAGLAAGLGFTVVAVMASGLAYPNVDGLSKTALLASLGWAIVPAAAASVGDRVSETAPT